MDTQTITKRLEDLKSEAEAGRKMLAELDAKKASVQNTLLRICGAIQVLEELLAEQVKPDPNHKGESNE